MPRGATVAWHVAWPRGAKPPQVPHSDSPGIHELTRPLSTLFTALDPRRARSTMTTERVSVITDIIDFIILCVVPAQPKSCSWHVGHGRCGDLPMLPSQLTAHPLISALHALHSTHARLCPRVRTSLLSLHICMVTDCQFEALPPLHQIYIVRPSQGARSSLARTSISRKDLNAKGHGRHV